jgi:hypothetical protein
MRRLTGTLLDLLHFDQGSSVDREKTVISLHNQIDKWYSDIPKPPHASSPSYDQDFLELNYHLLLVFLYKPGQSTPPPKPSRLPLLRSHAHSAINLQLKMYREQRCAENYVHLHNITTAAATLLYTISAGDGEESNLFIESWARESLIQINTCDRLFACFCQAWPFVSRLRSAFTTFSAPVRARLLQSINLNCFDVGSLLNVAESSIGSNKTSFTIFNTEGPTPSINLPDDPTMAEAWRSWTTEIESIPQPASDINPMIDFDFDAFMHLFESSEAMPVDNLLSDIFEQ